MSAPDFTDRAREIAINVGAHYSMRYGDQVLLAARDDVAQYIAAALQDAYALGQAAGAEAMREEAASSAVRNRFDDEHCENECAQKPGC